MKKFSVILALCLVLMAGSAMATNIRPVNTGNLGVLQSFFDGTLTPFQNVDLGIDAVTDQNTNALFMPAPSALSDAAALMFYEGAGFFNTNVFGIYKASDPTTKLNVFEGPDNAPSTALVSWLGNDIWLGGISGAPDVVGFGRSFGYFLTTVEGNTFYSEDIRNPAGDPQMFIYQDKTFGNEWYLGIEDLVFAAGDKDFEDMIVKISEVSPVPEPTTMLLLGSGLIGLAGIGRRKFFKK